MVLYLYELDAWATVRIPPYRCHKADVMPITLDYI